MTGNTWDIIKIQTKTNQLIMGNRTDQIWVRRRRQRKTKSDTYSVLLAIATNIPVLLMTAFVLQGHKYFRL